MPELRVLSYKTMENRMFSNSSRDGFMRVLYDNTLNGGGLSRYIFQKTIILYGIRYFVCYIRRRPVGALQ